MTSTKKSHVFITVFIFILFFSLPLSNVMQNSIGLGELANSHIVSAGNLNDTSTEVMEKDSSNHFLEAAIKETKEFIPGGQSIGVQLQTLGILVVGHHQMKADKTANHLDDMDVQVGDIILEMNEKKVTKVEDVKPIVNEAGKNDESVKVKIKRNDRLLNITLQPQRNEKDNSYQIGLYIRDSATGIGTISFYDAETNKYGALGHIISDADTKKPIEINKGSIVPSDVTSIEKGNKGKPGEKQASFSFKDKKLGNITKNTHYGVFGKLDPATLKAKSLQQPLPLALSSEVKEGPATILTVVEGNKVDTFDIEIIKSMKQKHPSTKGMIIKVTDKRLLEKTGGIVQGMSGSPIIQNGKLIGAVTHVFVNDPTSGYGIHMEWMLKEAGIDPYVTNQKVS